ncbi:VOC family protein [Polyangium spumosum]|uniref:Aminotransferase n=1 Tax=Polyangium spumosum TaxID=889282 RepID=A0A6N7PZJ9_9BACT|nr:VOC family protein [Polyangium spumosum]MRG97423.1 aminotransferase [Polyangium spumosum]
MSILEPSKPAPSNWPRISSALYYEDSRAAIEWLCRAFGFQVRLLVEGKDGSVEHSELVYGDGLVMVAHPKPEKFPHTRAPNQIGGANTQNMMVYVDDVEAHCARARAAGARIVKEPETVDYGEEYWSDRGYECVDIGGHHWWFYQRLRDPKTA